jgi:predicted nucleic acid-binding protein
VLVLDETLYVSKKKYGVDYTDTAEFIRQIVEPCSKILGIGVKDYGVSIGFLGSLKPSDALHVAVMKNNGVSRIVSEDEDFDKIRDIKRVWL